MSRWGPALLPRALAAAAVWWAVSEGTAWRYAVVAVPAAVGVSLRLAPPRRPRPAPVRRLLALARLVAWFLWRSAVGGVDVARRALSRPLDLRPGVVEHRLGLPEGAGRVLVVDMVSLMPGTLSARLDGDVLTVHALDVTARIEEQVRALEGRVARALGVDDLAP